MRYHFLERREFAFFARLVVIMAALSVLLQLLVLYYMTELVVSVDLWCGKRYKPEYVSPSTMTSEICLKMV